MRNIGFVIGDPSVEEAFHRDDGGEVMKDVFPPPRSNRSVNRFISTGVTYNASEQVSRGASNAQALSSECLQVPQRREVLCNLFLQRDTVRQF